MPPAEIVLVRPISVIGGGAFPLGGRSRRAGASAIPTAPTAKPKDALSVAHRSPFVLDTRSQPMRHAQNARVSESSRSMRSSMSACLAHWRNNEA